MEKRKTYANTKFSSRLLRKVIDRCASLSKAGTPDRADLSASTPYESWHFDDTEEYLAHYSGNDVTGSFLNIWWDGVDVHLALDWTSGHATVSVGLSSRSSIESIFSLFEEATDEDKIRAEVTDEPSITIFIGHGRNRQWELLKSHLQDKHGLEIITYETGARAGHAIRDILDSMADKSSLALLVLTGEDKTDDGVRARQNVIHECGLFQGRLGFDRAILLVEHGVELASNFDGIQQLRFKKGRISEIFGDVLATIRREFGPV